MTEGLRFRRYDPADAEAVLSLHRWALRDAGTDPADVPGTDDLQTVQVSYLDADGDFVVGIGSEGDSPDSSDGRKPPLTDDGPLVAMGGYLPSDEGYDDERSVSGAAELHRMRVAPTHQRRGYGQALLDELETRAVEAGFDLLLATTARRQQSAVEFYPSEGYREVDRTHHGEYELVHFEKRV
jgi:ribosomal protein S18 acetylase RimI-like enzyme